MISHVMILGDKLNMRAKEIEKILEALSNGAETFFNCSKSTDPFGMTGTKKAMELSLKVSQVHEIC